MELTTGILFFLMSREADLQTLYTAADCCPVHAVKRYNEKNGQGTEEAVPGTVYILSGQKDTLLFACKEPCTLLWTGSGTCEEDPLPDTGVTTRQSEGGCAGGIPVMALDDQGGLIRDTGIALQDGQTSFVRNVSAVLWRGQSDPDLAGVRVYETWNWFLAALNQIVEECLKQKDPKQVLNKAHTLLGYSFSVIDRDMMILYETEDIRAMTEVHETERSYISELVEELVFSKHFQEVAHEKTPFYYDVSVPPYHTYGCNIFLHEEYYARMVVYLFGGEKRLPSGAEQLVPPIAALAGQMLENGMLKMSRNINDQMHALCRLAGTGAAVPDMDAQSGLASYGWRQGQDFQVLRFRIYNAAGWNAHLETELPVIERRLESTWPHSCAVVDGQEVFWVINRSLSIRKGADSDFFQHVIFFIRENACRAGSSAVFNDFSLLPSAGAQASAALEIGSHRDPTAWYFSFDDYRLDYMMKNISGGPIRPELLAHPALRTLRAYDAAHETELEETLRIFLDCHMNMTAAAQKMFVHRTTLFRRMETIRGLTGIRLEDADEALELVISYRLQAL